MLPETEQVPSSPLELPLSETLSLEVLNVRPT